VQEASFLFSNQLGTPAMLLTEEHCRAPWYE